MPLVASSSPGGGTEPIVTTTGFCGRALYALGDRSKHVFDDVLPGPNAAMARLLVHLADRDLVVVLDNCEQVIAGVAELVRDLVAASGQLRQVRVIKRQRSNIQLIPCLQRAPCQLIRITCLDQLLRTLQTLPPSRNSIFVASERSYVTADSVASASTSGVSAGGMPTRVKCLHVLVGHSLAAGPGVNPLGDEARTALDGEGIDLSGLAALPGPTGVALILVGLAALAVGGVGVQAAVRSHLDRKTATIATLKTLGAEGGLIFRIYLWQILVLTGLGIGIGLVLGAGLPLAFGDVIEAALPFPAAVALHPGALLEAAFYGVMTALLFTLWPLSRSEVLRAAALYRAGRHQGWPRPRRG